MDRAELLSAFGSRVREARKSRGWTQEDLSARSGLAVVQISRVERGVREIRLTTLLKLAAALGVTADHLLAGLYSSVEAPEGVVLSIRLRPPSSEDSTGGSADRSSSA